jgi:lysozyme family protein
VNFDRAFEILLQHEGGFVNDSRDRGGATKYGISKRSYPKLDIASLTLDDAKAIYKSDFWGPLPQVDEQLRFHLFDCAVHSGVHRALQILQDVLDVAPDGKFGQQSWRAYAQSTFSSRELSVLYSAKRLEFLTQLNGWSSFGKGWARRIALNLQLAIKESHQ